MVLKARGPTWRPVAASPARWRIAAASPLPASTVLLPRVIAARCTALGPIVARKLMVHPLGIMVRLISRSTPGVVRVDITVHSMPCTADVVPGALGRIVARAVTEAGDAAMRIAVPAPPMPVAALRVVDRASSIVLARVALAPLSMPARLPTGATRSMPA